MEILDVFSSTVPAVAAVKRFIANTIHQTYQRVYESGKLAMVFDIDGTLLFQKGETSVCRPNSPVANLYFWVREHYPNIKIIIITARPNIAGNRDHTVRQLIKCGFLTREEAHRNNPPLFLMPVNEAANGDITAPGRYKQRVRSELKKKHRYTILFNVGDAWGDMSKVGMNSPLARDPYRTYVLSTNRASAIYGLKLPDEP